jgi:hypothetical protein
MPSKNGKEQGLGFEEVGTAILRYGNEPGKMSEGRGL